MNQIDLEFCASDACSDNTLEVKLGITYCGVRLKLL